MSDHNVILGVGAYASGGVARQDCMAISRATDGGSHRVVAAACVSKGPGGASGLAENAGPAPRRPLERTLLGAALTVLAAPVGIAYLSPVVTTSDSWTMVRA